MKRQDLYQKMYLHQQEIKQYRVKNQPYHYYLLLNLLHQTFIITQVCFGEKPIQKWEVYYKLRVGPRDHMQEHLMRIHFLKPLLVANLKSLLIMEVADISEDRWEQPHIIIK